MKKKTVNTTKKRNKLAEKLVTIAIAVFAIFACAVFNPSTYDTATDLFDIPVVAADDPPAVDPAPVGGGAASDGDSSGAWDSLMSTFVSWIQKAGGVVIFVGGIMFALAIKNNDAEQKQAGLLTMIAGFAVVAVCGLSSKFM